MEELIYQKIENILEFGEEGYDPPEKLDDLELSLKLFVQAYQKAKLDHVPEEYQRLLRRYIDELADLMSPPAIPTSPVGPAPQEAPGPVPPMDASMPPTGTIQ